MLWLLDEFLTQQCRLDSGSLCLSSLSSRCQPLHSGFHPRGHWAAAIVPSFMILHNNAELVVEGLDLLWSLGDCDVHHRNILLAITWESATTGHLEDHYKQGLPWDSRACTAYQFRNESVSWGNGWLVTLMMANLPDRLYILPFGSSIAPPAPYFTFAN